MSELSDINIFEVVLWWPASSIWSDEGFFLIAKLQTSVHAGSTLGRVNLSGNVC